MLPESLDILRCPVCEGDFYFDEVGTGGATAGTLRCDKGHAFDFAKQGYVNLVPGGQLVHTADDDAMVTARARFLGRGHYDLLATRIAELLLERVAGQSAAGSDGESTAEPASEAKSITIIDAGAGTGYYAAAVGALAESTPALAGRVGIIAADVSKYALRRAAKAHDNITAIGADTWEGLPVQSASADALFCVFAPRNAGDFSRVLKPGGTLLVARPSANHMAELRSSADLIKIGGAKEEDLERKLAPYFETVHAERVEAVLTLSHQDVLDLVMMGPNRHHTSPDKLREVISYLPNPAPTTMSVELTVYRRRGAK